MREKKLSPEYCKNGKIRAYQCGICDRLDVDDVSREAFELITGAGRIGVHR